MASDVPGFKSVRLFFWGHLKCFDYKMQPGEGEVFQNIRETFGIITI